MTTVYLALLYGASFAVQVASWVGCVWLGTRWAGVSTTLSRIVGIAVIWFSVRYALLMTRLPIARLENPMLFVATEFLALLVMTAVTLFLFRREFRTSWGKTMKIWIASWLAVIPSVLLAFVIRATLVEAFSVPTNAMAPTILGRHGELACPKCDGKAYHGIYPYPRPSIPTICDRFHTSDVPAASPDARNGDRVLVAKWIQPKRWDLVVFRNPAAPQQNYVKRLIGLPGETVCIAGGKIVINGEEVERPSEIAELRYEDTMEGNPVWGKDPITLGADEYFVLGDFSLQSLDSRMWSTGAPGHPPYAVPAENMIGVATHIYWPLARFRTFR